MIFRRPRPTTRSSRTLRSRSLCRCPRILSRRRPRPCASLIVRRPPATRRQLNRRAWPDAPNKFAKRGGLLVLCEVKDGKPSLISRLRRAGNSPELSARHSPKPSVGGHKAPLNARRAANSKAPGKDAELTCGLTDGFKFSLGISDFSFTMFPFRRMARDPSNGSDFPQLNTSVSLLQPGVNQPD